MGCDDAKGNQRRHALHFSLHQLLINRDEFVAATLLQFKMALNERSYELNSFHG